ncbi:GTPase-activating protein BEM2 [Lachancea thermotolerans CBS 6340]|uniref:KLTH0H07282p n=1 Tax=Lachancea thermotolerans (strain ATCC 56472 / CBS 6340 / NRRL Y-8284) TaxID=559295 RepID=C5E2S3_LACTC|nr:KLTH0H07282p [Lachancea thermotolerans CBS 6340]CAR30334.1 KLTH0H07282p [Lachancea thermotolerans CBS 6340]
MKSLRWSGRGKKSSSSSSSDDRHSEHSSQGQASPAQHWNKPEGSSHSTNSQALQKKPTVFGKHMTSSPSIYLSETSNRSNRSLSSSRASITGEDLKHEDTHTNSTVADDRTTMVTSFSAETNGTSRQQVPLPSLNNDNYDNTTFKVGWVNKAAPFQAANNRDSRVYGNSSASLDPQSGSKRGSNFRLHRAALRGCVLSLYKSGIGNVKYFDPNLPPPAHLMEQQYHETFSPAQPAQKAEEPLAVVEKQQNDLSYLSEEYPHPELKLDKDGRLLSGSNESICHMILFCPYNNDENTRKIIDVLLILPLIDKFGVFLNIFQLFGVTFTRHRVKLVNSARQHHQISAKADTLMTERLALVVKAILDVFSGFLLDDKLFSQIVDLVDIISLHDDEISTNLKVSIVERQNRLSTLCSFTKQRSSPEEIGMLVDVEQFMKLDLDDVARSVHQINHKFIREWSPQIDYSLLYESKFNEKHIYMNPMVFRNSENVHFLGRLLTTHLFVSNGAFTPHQRATVLSTWVQLGCKFEKLGDMVSWLAIATIICSVPVLRLASTWQFVPEQTLRVIFKDWVPTIVQLDRRQISSKSTNSVFILAPPNLNDSRIRESVIPFFGDLAINANDLPPDTKFKYLEKKIHRTKNAFYKWHQRIEQAKKFDNETERSALAIPVDDGKITNTIFRYWKYHLDQEQMNIDAIMDLSLALEPPKICQKQYSATSTRRSALLTGSYLPMLFNDMFPNYSIFPRDSLIGAAGVSGNETKRRPVSTQKVGAPQKLIQDYDQGSITGVERIDEPVAKEISSKVSNKQKLLKLIRDAFNIDMDMFHISDDIIFKAADDVDGRSRPASVVIETPKRMSQHSSITAARDSQDINRLSSAMESLDFFSNIGKSTGSINESFIQVVLKCATLDKLFDVLVLTTSVFSKVVDTEDLEKYFYHERKRQNGRAQSSDSASVGPLDYAFVRLLMDNDIFTETFFNTYRSFTTTTIVLENLAKRFIGAVSGAVSISRVVNSGKQRYSGSVNSSRFSGFVDATSSNSRFPAWDIKVTEEDEVNLTYMAKIQIGAMEALLHLVNLHYSDFTDCLVNNTTFLDILKIMDQEVNEEWKKRVELFSKSKLEQPEFREEVAELEQLQTTLKLLFKKLKSCYQKQLYRPLGVSKTQRLTQSYLKDFTTIPLRDLSIHMNDPVLEDKFVASFNRLSFDDYSELPKWVYGLNELVCDKLALVSNQDWVDVSQILELFSNESLVSLYQYPLHTISHSIIQSAGSQLDDLEILNVFTWLTTLSVGENEMLFDKLAPSVQMIIKLHISITQFFILQIAHPDHTIETRANICTIILQLLNFTRWKNSSMDLFHDGKQDKCTTAISPHVPSFLETCLTNAIVAPESRYYEMLWKNAHKKLAGPNAAEVKDVSNILDGIDAQIRFFVEYDESQISKPKSLSPCPGWLITRLLEISQFVPNMSIENSRMINFDKRRFVNNIIINFREMVPYVGGHSEDGSSTNFDSDLKNSILFHEIVDIGKAFRKLAKEKAAEEARKSKYQASGLFNSIIVAEVDKIKRDQKKKMELTIQDNDSKRKNMLEHAVKHKNRLSSSPSLLSLGQSPARGPPVDPEFPGAGKRSSLATTGTRSSIISNSSTHSNGSMGKKLGGFFKRPFSIGGFSSSSSTHGLNAILLSGVQPNGSISPFELPDITSSVFKDTKPVYSIRTFEIKSCIPVSGINKLPQTDHSFKIVMENGVEHIVQGTSYIDMMEWIRLINISRRYSFHSQKYKGKTSNKIFGVPIEDVCERECSIIPNIVVKLLEEIELRGLDEMGLYRVPGSVGSINALKNAFDEEGAVSNSFTLEDDRWFEINTIAGCFKLYLRELPDSLFTKEKLPLFVSLALSYKSNEIDYEQFQAGMKDALKSLPLYNFHMMKRTFEHLHRVDEHVENNRMDATNLAIVFSMSFIDQDDLASSMGPTLGALQTILQSFIRNPADFF